MLIVRITTRVPSHSVFKPDQITTGYLQMCCKRSYRILEDARHATEFNSNLEANTSIDGYGLNVKNCEIDPSPNPLKKKTGFF